MAKPDPQVAKALLITAELFGHTFSRETAEMFGDDLAMYPANAVLSALGRCRKECQRFPTVSQVIERIDDGRPGPEEAWAMIPTDEDLSVVWTSEMAEAYGHARNLLPDKIAARLAFKESYTKLLAEARARAVPAKWTPSMGQDRASQQGALTEAVQRGRLTVEQAHLFLPDLSSGKPAALIEGPEEPPTDPERVRAVIREAFKGKDVDPFRPEHCRHEDAPEIRRSTQELGAQKYLTTYHQCPRCEALYAKNFPLKEESDKP